VQKVLAEVAAERARQDHKWGEQNHEDAFWYLILGEEVGEVAKATLDSVQELREELIQVAAVAVSWIEAIDRRP
jgi:NTP pyrophosphatase (non-canonical NTP hydrolase)